MKRLLIYICMVVSLSLVSCALEPQAQDMGGETPPKALIEFSSDCLVVPGEGGTFEVVVKSRYMPICESYESWITCTAGDKEYYDMPLQITVGRNARDEREGSVIVTIRDEEFNVEYSKEILIHQGVGVPDSVSIEALFNDNDCDTIWKEDGVIYVTAAASMQDIQIKSNASWSFTYMPSWIKPVELVSGDIWNTYNEVWEGSGNKTMYLNIDENDNTTKSRNVTVGLSAGDASASLSIVQVAGFKADFVELEDYSGRFYVPSEGGAYTLRIESSADWSIEVDKSYSDIITFDTCSGTGNRDVKVTIAENNLRNEYDGSGCPRYITVNVSPVKDTTMSRFLVIQQYGPSEE